MEQGILIGMALAIIFTAKPLNVFVKELADQSPGVFAYILLGLSFLISSWVLGWLGFICIATTFVLYHVVGGEGFGKLVKSVKDRFASFRATKRTKPDPEDADVTAVEEDEGAKKDE